MKLDRESAIKMLQGCAMFHGAEHEYTPKSIPQSMEFQPHEWVIKAVLLAYKYGAENKQLAINNELVNEMYRMLEMSMNILNGDDCVNEVSSTDIKNLLEKAKSELS